MSIIQEIHAWSKGLPAWQQDAIARLYQDRTLSVVDLDDLYALAKAEVGIADPDDRKAMVLEDAQVAPPADPTRVVRIAASHQEKPLLICLALPFLDDQDL